MSIPQTPSPLSNILAAKIYNAAWFSGSTEEAQITAAIVAAATDGATHVHIPASMLPYNASAVTFNTSIRMIREGGDPSALDILAYGATGDGTVDDTVPLQNVLAAAAAVVSVSAGGAVVTAPAKSYKITTQPVVGGSIIIKGHGNASSVFKFFGCAGFKLTDSSGLTDLGVMMLSAGGAIDPKTLPCVEIPGTVGTHLNNITLHNLQLRGGSEGIKASYTWSSNFDFIYTVFCGIGYRSLGLCGNDSISNSLFGIGGATRGISLEQDAGTHGEGLMISNTYCQGTTGLWADQFIGLSIANGVFDQCGTGLSLTNCTGSMTTSWVYATTGDAVRFEDLGAYTVGGFKISNCHSIWSTFGHAIYIGTFSRDIIVTGNTLKSVTSPFQVGANVRFCVLRPNTYISPANVMSMTGIDGAVSQMDADISFTIPDNEFLFQSYWFNVNLAGAQTCTLPLRASSWNGRGFWIARVAGAGTLTVQEAAADGAAVLKVLPAATPSSVYVEFAGALGTPAWKLTNYSVL